jgi:PIN domain nuclease of toxin-antitoxin system
VRLLVDTNVFLAHFGPDGIDPRWSEAIDAADQVFFSTASVWEIAIKCRKGKLQLHSDPVTFVSAGMEQLQLMPLDITARHALATVGLPMHHADPFDRILVAQAMSERLTIVTSDRIIPKYGVPVFGHKTRKAKRS